MDSSALRIASYAPDGRVQQDQRTTGPVVGVLLDEESNQEAIQLTCALAAGVQAPIRLLRPVTVPWQTPLELPDSRLNAEHEIVRSSLRSIENRKFAGSTDGTVVVGHDIVRTVAHTAQRWNARALVFDITPEESIRAQLRGNIAEQVSSRTDCPVLAGNDGLLSDEFRSILVPVAGGPHSLWAVWAAVALAKESESHVDLLHVKTLDAGKDPENETTEAVFERALDKAEKYPRVDTFLIEDDDAVSTIIAQSHYYDLTVIGGPEHNRLRRFVFGSDTNEIEHEAKSPVITVWCGYEEY